MYWGEVAVEVAVDFLGAVILNFDSRGHWRAFWGCGTNLGRQRYRNSGWSTLCCEAGGLQSWDGWEDSGGGASGSVCLHLGHKWRLMVSSWQEWLQRKAGIWWGLLGRSQTGKVCGRALSMLVHDRLVVHVTPWVGLIRCGAPWIHNKAKSKHETN